MKQPPREWSLSRIVGMASAALAGLDHLVNLIQQLWQ